MKTKQEVVTLPHDEHTAEKLNQILEDVPGSRITHMTAAGQGYRGHFITVLFEVPNETEQERTEPESSEDSSET